MVTQKQSEGRMGRRGFLAGAAAATLTIVKPGSARGAEANSQLELGLIGCGNRGCWIADLFQKNTKTRLVAAHDYFPAHAHRAVERFGVPAARCTSGLSGYKRLLEGKLDAVAIESPPYFHPEQAAAAVEAGKHVFCAKPVGVDAPGCTAIGAAGKKATARKLCFLVDFQTRANEFYTEAVRRVQAGDIGTPVYGQAYYPSGMLSPRGDTRGTEGRLRNYFFDLALSGDIIVDQGIHVIDVATWILDAAPTKAFGTGGRRVRTQHGDCWDHFLVTYWFPNEVLIDFSDGQFVTGFHAMCTRVYGSRGTIDTHYGGPVLIRGKKSYKGGRTGGIYTTGAVNNIKAFWQNVAEGKCANETVAPSVRTTLASVLGRIAAYEGRVVTWDEMMKANTRLDAKLEGLKA